MDPDHFLFRVFYVEKSFVGRNLCTMEVTSHGGKNVKTQLTFGIKSKSVSSNHHSLETLSGRPES